MDFSEPRLYNAPSLHTVDFLLQTTGHLWDTGWQIPVCPTRSPKNTRWHFRASTIALTRARLGLLGAAPPDPALESASPSPRQGLIWHRFNIDSTLIRHRFPDLTLNRCRINVESMPNRPLTRGGRGGFEGGVWGGCA